MSSRGGGRKPYGGGNSNDPKGKNVPQVEQLSQGVTGVTLDSAQDDVPWEEVVSRKPKNKAAGSAAKPWGSQNTNSKGWGQPDAAQKFGTRNSGGSGNARVQGNAWATQPVDSRRPAGRGNMQPYQSYNRGVENNYVNQQPVIAPPLEHGWNWQSRPAAAAATQFSEDTQNKEDVEVNREETDDDDEGDLIDDDDDFLSDDYDSDASIKSHETRKKSKCFKNFFEVMEKLSIEEIKEPTRQWHCPACYGGPGAIDWYRGLQPLMTHAKTKGASRVKLHRELAELLDEELNRRGSSVVPAGEVFGQWKGLKNEEKDHEIVWPPMVIIMNTRLDQDDNDKWIGMGNQELLDYFSAYDATRARHSYGPQGHRGMSVLIFESSGKGYLEAERLHRHFAEQGTDRNAWDRYRVLFSAGGMRQLYGYMATKADLESFNQHSQGKTKLKYEMRSYREMVVNQIRQMSEDNQQLIYLKNKYGRELRHSKALEESLGIISEKLRKTQAEERIVRQRTQLHHEQNKEELDCQEQFFKEQLKIIYEGREAKEEDFEKLQQEEREKVKHEESKSRKEVENFIGHQEKEMENFVTERDTMLKTHAERKAAMKKRHWEEEVELEKDLDAELTLLMQKYEPHHSEGGGIAKA